MDLRRTRVAQHLHYLPGRVTTDDRVIDDDQPLARDDLRQRVEFEPQAMASQLLPRLDERPSYVAVLDEAVVLRKPSRASQPPGGGVAGVRNRDHDIGLDRRLAP